MRLTYVCGNELLAGDRVKYHGEPGYVSFVVTEKTGDPSLDWFVDEFPGGGAMVVAEGFGHVFLGVADLDDFLEFVARS